MLVTDISRLASLRCWGSTALGETLGEILTWWNEWTLGEIEKILAKSKISWWNRFNLGEIDGLLVKWVDSWWNQKDLGEIIFRQDKTNFSLCLKERRIIDILHHVLIGQTCYLWRMAWLVHSVTYGLVHRL